MEGEKETERKRNQKKYQESQGGEKGFKTRGWVAVPEAEHMRKAENGEAPAGAGGQRTHWLTPEVRMCQGGGRSQWRQEARDDLAETSPRESLILELPNTEKTSQYHREDT